MRGGGGCSCFVLSLTGDRVPVSICDVKGASQRVFVSPQAIIVWYACHVSTTDSVVFISSTFTMKRGPGKRGLRGRGGVKLPRSPKTRVSNYTCR